MTGVQTCALPISANQLITPALISMAASVGKRDLLVKQLPKVVIISSGDEVVNIDETPNAFQIRRSNNYTIKAALQQYCINQTSKSQARECRIDSPKDVSKLPTCRRIWKRQIDEKSGYGLNEKNSSANSENNFEVICHCLGSARKEIAIANAEGVLYTTLNSG